jgi:hypothetical protein
MPYIDAKARERIDRGSLPMNAGELNYQITRLVLGFLGASPRYQDFNNAVGALECCKLELYRRMIGPYENVKIADNGDVFPGTQ